MYNLITKYSYVFGSLREIPKWLLGGIQADMSPGVGITPGVT